jgi:hypothetical protein
MNEDELNWAAGMFEGEGTIRIAKEWSRKRERNYRLQCIVPNTDHQIVDFFHKRWQGSNRPERPRGNQRPQRKWVVSGKQAEAFLRQLQPHLRTDRGRMRVNVAFQFQIMKKLYKDDPTDRPKYRDEQRKCYEEMGRLNPRGAAAKSKTQQA